MKADIKWEKLLELFLAQKKNNTKKLSFLLNFLMFYKSSFSCCSHCWCFFNTIIVVAAKKKFFFWYNFFVFDRSTVIEETNFDDFLITKNVEIEKDVQRSLEVEELISIERSCKRSVYGCKAWICLLLRVYIGLHTKFNFTHLFISIIFSVCFVRIFFEDILKRILKLICFSLFFSVLLFFFLSDSFSWQEKNCC